MAYAEHFDTPSTGLALRGMFARLLETPFDRRYRARTDAIRALQSKSDDDLAAMGLTRADIVSHVFSGRAAR